jgi:hypothetical protein
MTRISVTPAIAPAANWYWNGRALLAGRDWVYTFDIWRGHGDDGVDLGSVLKSGKVG